MFENVYVYHIPYGDLFLYGDNINMCRQYIDDAIDSVEDICDYCAKHNLRIFHKPNRSLNGLLEIFRVRRLTKKYSVYSSWKELKHYLETTQ